MTVFDIEVQAIINIAYINMFTSSLSNEGIPIDGADPTLIMNWIRNKLLAKRKNLSYVVNGKELIPKISANTGKVDSSNGPDPKYCMILELSSESFLISYRIIASYYENMRLQYVAAADSNLALNQQGSPVLYNRWEETVHIDQLQLTKRTRTGKFVIRSDNENALTADQLRNQFAVLGVPAGFVRESQVYKVTADGLSIEYNITDQEVHRMPPSPASKADGEYTETAGKGGINRTGEVRVRLTGSKADWGNIQPQMLNAAIGICVRKLNIRGLAIGPAAGGQPFFGGGPPEPRQKGIIVYTKLTSSIYTNEVSMSIGALFTNFDKRVQGVAGIRDQITTSPGSNATEPAYKSYPYGTFSYLLRAAAYYDPSLRGQKLNQQTGQMQAAGGIAVEPGEGGKSVFA